MSNTAVIDKVGEEAEVKKFKIQKGSWIVLVNTSPEACMVFADGKLLAGQRVKRWLERDLFSKLNWEGIFVGVGKNPIAHNEEARKLFCVWVLKDGAKEITCLPPSLRIWADFEREGIALI